jgi:hypothetical protein
MFEEVKNAIGANWFRAFVVAIGCLWVVHTFSGTVPEFLQAENVGPQAQSAATREPAVARGAVADAAIKEATAGEALARQKAERESAEAEAQIRQATAREALARQRAERESAEAEAKIREATARETLRRQKAEADEAIARACNQRMTQLTQNMRLDDIDRTNGHYTIKPGTPTALMQELYNKDCNPTFAEFPVSSGAVEAYKGMKQAASDSTGLDKLGDIEASIRASCLVGVRIASLLQLGEEGSNGMVGNSVSECHGTTIAYASPVFRNFTFDDVPSNLSQSQNDTLLLLRISQQSAYDINQCTKRKPDYTGLLTCSCITGATIGAVKALPSGDHSAHQILVNRSTPACQRL